MVIDLRWISEIEAPSTSTAYVEERQLNTQAAGRLLYVLGLELPVPVGREKDIRRPR